MSAYDIAPIEMCVDCEVRRDIPDTDTHERILAQRGVERILRASDEQYERYVYGGWEGYTELLHKETLGLSERYAESALSCAMRHKAGGCTVKFTEVMVEIS